MNVTPALWAQTMQLLRDARACISDELLATDREGREHPVIKRHEAVYVKIGDFLKKRGEHVH